MKSLLSLIKRRKKTIFICDLCSESMPLKGSFKVNGCTHFYCKECIVKFIVSKLQYNVTDIMCPAQGCRGKLDPEYCRAILPKTVFDRWGYALCQNLIVGSEAEKHLYCPFNDCSALLIHDEVPEAEGSRWKWPHYECPHCWREFCASCKAPWHSEINCAEFQKLMGNKGHEEKMVKELADILKWMRCPKCKTYVEKTYGCNHMTCRSVVLQTVFYTWIMGSEKSSA